LTNSTPISKTYTCHINFVGKRQSEHTEFLSIYDFVGNEFELCVLVQI